MILAVYLWETWWGDFGDRGYSLTLATRHSACFRLPAFSKKRPSTIFPFRPGLSAPDVEQAVEKAKMESAPKASPGAKRSFAAAMRNRNSSRQTGNPKLERIDRANTSGNERTAKRQ